MAGVVALMSLVALSACGEEEKAKGMPGALATEGPLGDRAMGSEAAPVTIIEYASMTCPHCAQFELTILPALKKHYIDTGKVRFVFREYPLDPLAMAAFMLARCAQPEHYFGFIHVLFAKQEQWAFVRDNNEARNQLKAIARQGGFSNDDFEACMKKQEILDHIRDVHDRADVELGVKSTPTIFINGVERSYALTFEELQEIIDPLLTK